MNFDGFSKTAFTFLNELSENNTKSWFEENKTTYQDELLKPAISFIEAVGKELQKTNPEISYDTRTNGSGSLMRIYRDTRFSKDKTPYKTNISAIWWQGAGKKTEHPGFGFQLDATSMKLMAGMFGFSKEQLEQYRNAVLDDKSGKKLIKILSDLGDDYSLNEQHYKRVPRGFDVEHPRAHLLQYNSLYAFPKKDLKPSLVKSRDLVDSVLKHFKALTPLHQWLVKELN